MTAAHLESITSAAGGEQIELSFDNSAGGAWDDRELINSYDAAMDEFHMHHPGPGSWLDKAMAATKLGQPLPGATPTSTSWYSATSNIAPVATTTLPTPIATPNLPQKRRKKNNHKNATAGPSNPYASTSAQAQLTAGRQSPSYAPPSPGANGEEAYDDIEDWYDESFALTANPEDAPEGGAEAEGADAQVVQDGYEGYVGHGSRPAPAAGVQSTAEVSVMDAMGYAMTAQYWAGYWMGVAQAKTASVSQQVDHRQHQTNHNIQTKGLEGNGISAVQAGPTQQDGEEEPSNVFITKKQFHKPTGNGLKR